MRGTQGRAGCFASASGANDTADLVLPHDEGSTFDDPADIRARRALPDAGRDAVHAELLIDDSVAMVKDAQDDKFNALLCTCWPDVDAAWDRACAPARVIYPLADHFYGERGGRLGDPFGNQWMLAARRQWIRSMFLLSVIVRMARVPTDCEGRWSGLGEG